MLPSVCVYYYYCVDLCHKQWLEDTFLGYLKEWEDSVHDRSGFSQSEKMKMMLSYETIAGLKMTGNKSSSSISVPIFIVLCSLLIC